MHLGRWSLQVRVEVRDVHEVDGRAVVDGFQRSTCVEVTHGIASLVLPGRGIRRRKLGTQRAESGLVGCEE